MILRNMHLGKADFVRLIHSQ